MTDFITYQFDPATGFIGATNQSNWPDDHLFLLTPNFLVTTAPIPAVHTTTHHDHKAEQRNAVVEAGWSFVLENGKPKPDEAGHPIVTPPEHHVPAADLHAHIFAGLVKAGYIDITHVHQDLLNSVNWSLDASGAPPIPGTVIVARPVKKAKVSASHMVSQKHGCHARQAE